jgi:hypothetical protein
VSVLMRLKRGLAAAWTSNNPVLADGEMGYSKDGGLIKVGNGTTAWADLPVLFSGVYLGTTAKAADSELLDGLDSTGYLKVGAKAADSELLDGLDSTSYVKNDDTGWLTTGITITPATNWVITSYILRRRNGRVIGNVVATYSGTTVTTDAQANFTDLTGVLAMPSGWRNLNGHSAAILVNLTGQKGFFGRVNQGVTGTIDITHGTYASQTLIAGAYTFTLDYMVD